MSGTGRAGAPLPSPSPSPGPPRPRRFRARSRGQRGDARAASCACEPCRGQPFIAALDRDRVGCSPAPNTCRARHFDLFGQRQRARLVRVGRLGSAGHRRSHDAGEECQEELDLAHRAATGLTARTYPVRGTGSRPGSDQRAVMAPRVRAEDRGFSWPIGPCPSALRRWRKRCGQPPASPSASSRTGAAVSSNVTRYQFAVATDEPRTGSENVCTDDTR